MKIGGLGSLTMAFRSMSDWVWPRVVADEWNEADHPRVPAGQPGGGEFGSAGGPKKIHPKTPDATFAKEPAKGTTDERTRIRLRMKVTKDPAERKLLREKMKQSYLISHAAAVKAGSAAKAQQYEASLAKMGVKVQSPSFLGSYQQAAEKAASSQPGYVGNFEEYKKKYPSNPVTAPVGEAPYKPDVSLKATLPTPETNPKQHMPPEGVYDKYSDTQMIRMYTGSHYRGINEGLRDGVLTEDQWKFTKGVNRGLDKLPNYEGTVYRKVSDPGNKIFNKYKVGTIVEERGFTSTSKRMKVWAGNTRYTIVSKTGKSVEHISPHKGSEAEVLFKSGTRFHVKKIDHANNVVYMDEVT
jgi:hypothetical protein